VKAYIEPDLSSGYLDRTEKSILIINTIDRLVMQVGDVAQDDPCRNLDTPVEISTPRGFEVLAIDSPARPNEVPIPGTIGP
jgi:hypothetical protein